MKGVSFVQICLGFLLVIFSVGAFQILGLDVDFVTMFILTIFTIVISIFFYTESGRMSARIVNLINKIDFNVNRIDSNVVQMKESTMGQYLNRLPTLSNKEDIERLYQNAKRK